MECLHPLAQLSLDTGRTGQRGQASMCLVVCSQCRKRLPAATGFKVLVERVQEDIHSVWAALRAVGLGRDQPQAIQQPVDSDRECPHHFSWIRVKSVGLQSRGHSGTLWFACAGCKASWTMTAGLKLFLDQLKGEHARIRASIRKLGSGS